MWAVINAAVSHRTDDDQIGEATEKSELIANVVGTDITRFITRDSVASSREPKFIQANVVGPSN